MRNIVFGLAFFSVLLGLRTAQAKYSGGTGEPNTPYRIATAEDLNDIGNHVEDFNKCFVMVNDINLSAYAGTQFNIIGEYFSWGDPNNRPFTGVFDGNGYNILNFSYLSEGEDFIGLFRGIEDPNNMVFNLTLVDVNVDGGTGDYVGGLTGFNGGHIYNCAVVGGKISGNSRVGGLIGTQYSEGLIKNCAVVGGKISGNSSVGGLIGIQGGNVQNSSVDIFIYGGDRVGGLIGVLSGGELSNCSASGRVEGVHDVGGAVGRIWNAELLNCVSSVEVIGYSQVGGLVGWGESENYIWRCVSEGNVAGDWSEIGGLVGSFGGDTSIIQECSSKGNVSGFQVVGGLIGYNKGTVVECFAVGDVFGRGQIGGFTGWSQGSYAYSYAGGIVSGYEEVGGFIGLGGGEVESCFWNKEVNPTVTGTGRSPDPDGLTGLPTGEMQMRSTFEGAGWDFDDVWAICEGTNYPRHIWSIPAADLVCPDGVNFIDYSYFAPQWLASDCNEANGYCSGRDLDESGIIDEEDLKILCSHWLDGI